MIQRLTYKVFIAFASPQANNSPVIRVSAEIEEYRVYPIKKITHGLGLLAVQVKDGCVNFHNYWIV